MPTVSDNTININSTAFNPAIATAKLKLETWQGQNIVLRIAKEMGLINYVEDLTRASGTTVTMPNAARIDSLGFTGDIDRYSNAAPLQTGTRDVKIRLVSNPVYYSLEGSERQQIARFDLTANAPARQVAWMQRMLTAWIMNQAGGNTATSISIPLLSSTAATTADDLLRVRGNNAAIAPSSRYKAIGSNGTGGVTADENITSSHPLVLSDFMYANEVIMSTGSGIPAWNALTSNMNGMAVYSVAFVSTTGMNQLLNQAASAGNALVLSQFIYSSMAGGKNFEAKAGIYYMNGMMFVTVPDEYLPRGVNSSTAAPVANTRRAIIMGAGAVDFAAGKGFSLPNGDSIGGFKVRVDEEHDKLNNQGYNSVEFNGGAVKAVLTGTGANAAVGYDAATYVISHYSRT